MIYKLLILVTLFEGIKYYKASTKQEMTELVNSCNNLTTKVSDLEINAKYLSEKLNISMSDAADSIMDNYWVFDYNKIRILDDKYPDDINFNPDGGIEDSIILKINYKNPKGYIILKKYIGNMYAISYNEPDTLRMNVWFKVIKVSNLEDTDLPNKLDIFPMGLE